MSELLAVVVLVVVLAAAVVRPRGWNEAVVAVPGAVVVLVTGLVPWSVAGSVVRGLTPTVLFLLGILAFGHLCAAEGVFDHLGALAGRASGSSPRRLLGAVVVLAAAVTTVLTLDATIVLLTPVVVRTVQRMAVPGRPHLYACVALANAGSLLLPVSNLTNLLAFSASGVSLPRFVALMAAPFVLVCLVEWVAIRVGFRADLHGTATEVPDVPPAPRYALMVLGATVAGFVVTSSVGVPPAWAALGAVLLLGLPRLVRRRDEARQIVVEANVGFGLFVLALGVVVEAVVRHGLGGVLVDVVPHGSDSLPVLLAFCGVAALLANVVNNIPATLVMLAVVAAAAPGSAAVVLAVLLGVNIGPNLTYAGSLATLLWRRRIPAADRPGAAAFHLLGVATVPALLAGTTVLLWAVA